MTRTWTFGRKLVAGFGLMVLLTVAIGVTSSYALITVVRQKDRVITHHAENRSDALEMIASTEGQTASLRGYLLTDEQAYLEEAQQDAAEFSAALSRILERDLTDEGRRRAIEIRGAGSLYQTEVDSIVAQRRAGADAAAILASFSDRVAPAHEALARQVRDFFDREVRLMEDTRQQANDAARRALAIVAGLSAAVIALAIAGASVLIRSLTRQIGISVQHVRSSSTELQTAAGQQTAAAKEQAKAMGEVSTTMEELLTSSRQIAESARSVATIASGTAESAEAGQQTVHDARAALDDIRKQVDTIVGHMLDLGKKSQRIGGVVEIINELAEQTNILAINATIEASGAGQQGHRFAAVGEEIRKLADRVAGSAKEIRALIEEVRAAVNTTVMATETGSKAVDAGAERFAELAEAFERIGKLVDDTTDAAREIELSTTQQTTAVEQVNAAVTNVAQASRETEAGSEQTLQTASELASLSDDLSCLIEAQQPAV